MFGIPIYPPGATDFSNNGLGLLLPSECTISNGTHLTMTQPIEEDLRWAQVQIGCIVKAATPMRESPLYVMTAAPSGTTSVTRSIYRVKTNGGRLHLRQKPSTSSAILGKYPIGTEVVKLEESGRWYRVSICEGGAVGWMYADYLVFDRNVTETITSSKPSPQSPIKVQPSRDQLYRIYSIETDTETGLQRAHALPLAYDLAKNPVGKEYSPENVPAAQAAREIFDAAQNPHDFTLHIGDIQGNITGEYGYKGIIECLMEPETGIAAQSGCVVIFDNLDIFLIPATERDMGVTIRRGKNLIGLTVTTDASEVYTRVIPRGRDAKGKNLYLSGIPYVDSPRIGSYPVIRSKVIDYDVEVSDDKDALFPTAGAARAELGRLAELEFSQNAIDSPAYGMTVDFVSLADVAEYAQYAHLQSVHLYDTVTVIDELIGLVSKVRATGYIWDVLSEQYIELILGEVNSLRQMTYGYSLAAGTVSGSKIIPGSVDGSLVLRDLSIQYAKIAVATIKQLNAEAVNAITGRFNEIAAGSITTDELYAAIAKIITLRVKQINAENITTDELYAALADVILLRAQQITADNIETDELAAAYAEITTLLVENINAGNVQADKLGAALANFVTMYASTGEFDFATIQNLVAKALSLEQASAESVYIKNLAVTSANLLSATLGKLVLKGDDGRHYRVFVGSDGSISTEEIVPTDDEIQNGQTSGGQQIVETSMNVGSLNASNLQASSAVINQILTTALTAEKITAADALIASASIPALYTTSIKALGAGLDLSANKYIQLIVGEVDSKIAAKSNVFRGETAPDDANVNDLWIVPSTGYTYQLAADDGSHPSYYLDENGVLYYSYGANQKEYALYMDDSGDLYISADTDFVAAITQDGTPALWQRVKDSELEDAAKAASDAAEAAQIAAQAAQDKANQNAEDMAQTVTRFEGELSSLQSQIDGSITTWFEYGAPTYYNYPASQWTTADMRNAHLGDLYYDRYTGYCYRWQLSGSAYEWTRISDTDVTKALNDAAAAKDVADSKRRVFVSTPTPPYDIGDLWVQGANGDILRCQKPRAAGGYYYASDWVPASKYTDDTKANENAQIIAQHTAELQLMDSRITARVEQSISEVSGELETQISSSFSEVTQTVDELRVVMEQNRAADKSELRTYLRYADGTLELGRSGSRYVARTSDNGFVVLQDGAEMAAMVQNTVSAPVVEARRQFVLGEYAIRIGADGGILFV